MRGFQRVSFCYLSPPVSRNGQVCGSCLYICEQCDIIFKNACVAERRKKVKDIVFLT